MHDPLDLYRSASSWAGEKVAGATTNLGAPTPCDEWDLRVLLSHMIQTQQYFAGTAQGREVPPPSPDPPDLIGNDPAGNFERARQDVVEVFSQPGVIERTGPSLGIAFSDVLVQGWDVARATRQDATMPDGLAEAAYDMIHGRVTEEQRKGVFKPAVDVPVHASPQERLLAYTGREPAR
jgi:uncharacterized protein (TIGR03086 family)